MDKALAESDKLIEELFWADLLLLGLDLFDQHRSLLFAIAYRMLGSVTEAEDIVQEAWIRWQSTESIVQSPKAFLSEVQV
jgi:hypothetical protein